MSDAEIACRSIFHDYDKNEIRAMPTSVRMAWQAGAQLVADEAAAPVSAPSVMLFDGGSWDLRGKQGEKLHTARAQWEREYIEKALREHNLNVCKTALATGIGRTQLYRLLDRHGIRPVGARLEQVNESLGSL